jgi:uncharacterized protein
MSDKYGLNLPKVEYGLSLYPDFYSFEVLEKRLRYAASLGYTRVFTSIQLGVLGFENTSDEISNDFKQLFKLCKELGIKIHVDINDVMFKQLGCTMDNLQPLVDLNIDVIRIDGGFNFEEIAQLTLNKQGVLIEDNTYAPDFNASRIDTMKRLGNLKQYRACHNFFPRNDTGLSFEDALRIGKGFKDEGIACGIFIGSLESPNDLNQAGFGVPTIEDHRTTPSHIAYSELRNTGIFDAVIFGDSMPSDQELQAVSRVAQLDYVELDAWLDKDLDPALKQVITETRLYARADQPPHVVRATQTRKKLPIPVYNTIHREALSITIDNHRHNRYEGEMQIMLEALPFDPAVNVVGRVKPTCKRLLNQVRYMQYPFKIKE